MSPAEFFGEPIEVESSDVLSTPQAFSWRGKKYIVSEVLRSWQDWGFGQSDARRTNWRLRHHRNYFLVKTDDGEVFKIYYDRGVRIDASKTWLLLTKGE